MDANLANGANVVATGGSAVFSVFISLMTVVALMLGLAWVLSRLRRLSAKGVQGVLQANATLALGMKERILLIDAAGQWILVSVTPGKIELLHKYESKPDALIAVEEMAVGNRFAELFNKIKTKRELAT
jgi:flagellar protein FliO/FliZ